MATRMGVPSRSSYAAFREQVNPGRVWRTLARRRGLLPRATLPQLHADRAALLSSTLALSWAVKPHRTSARPYAVAAASDFLRFVHAPAKSDNRPAIGSGSRPP